MRQRQWQGGPQLGQLQQRRPQKRQSQQTNPQQKLLKLTQSQPRQLQPILLFFVCYYPHTFRRSVVSCEGMEDIISPRKFEFLLLKRKVDFILLKRISTESMFTWAL